MKKILTLLSLVAAYLATSASDSKRVAELHRRRGEILDDEDLSEEERGHLESVLRAAESAPVTADSTAAAERLSSFLKREDAKPGESGSPASSAQSSPENPVGSGAAGAGEGGEAGAGAGSQTGEGGAEK